MGWTDATEKKCLLSLQSEAQRLYREGSRDVMRFHMKLDVAVEICKSILKLPLEDLAEPDLGTLRKRARIINSKEILIVPDPRDAALADHTKTAVLGNQTLSEVKSDMARLLLPSCVGRGPHRPGEAAGGRLKADEWRTFCTVNLPITLTRLWSGDSATTHERRMLKNFLHLVQAVRIASFREISNADVQAYEFHMHAYLTSLLSLYPGELEGTLFRHFTQGQRLRALFQTAPQMPPELESFIQSLSVQHDVDIRSTFMQDKWGFGNPSGAEDESSKRRILLQDSVYTLLKTYVAEIDPKASDNIPRHSLSMRRVKRLDGVYRPLSSSKKDCHIVFDRSRSRYAGQIRAIMEHTRGQDDGSHITETFLLVAPFLPLSEYHSTFDVFRRFPTSGILFYNRFASEILIRLRDVVCHVALTCVEAAYLGIPEDCVHVLPLER
ncbi:Zn(2)-C6 fungal-type domain-containing protein [Salix suchowensis]|nr:Zn(2)-C6 fungal-type domain-containing protein [Salix suchowensis]